MKEEYNSMAFTPDEVKKGLHLKLLNTLLELTAAKDDGSYNDIHIWSDGYCTIIDWIDYDEEFGCGKFRFVNADECVMYEGIFPDNHSEMCWDEEDFKNRLDEWLKENPGWAQNEWGAWYNKAEQEAFQKMLKEQKQAKKKGKTKEELLEEGKAAIPVDLNGAC